VGNDPWEVDLAGTEPARFQREANLGVPRPPTPVRPTRLQVGLFLLTVLSTLLVGAAHEGVNPLANPAQLLRGTPFAATLLGILFAHEMGHYLAARRRGVDVTLPYFIPAPTLLGTFGAFIRVRSPMSDRGALLEVGAAGPIAGFLVALPAAWIGVASSRFGSIPEGGGWLELGESLLLKGIVRLVHGPVPAGQDLLLSPVGLAAWAGILVTALNLLPLGQLDGGHVAYALCGRRRSYWIGLGTIAVMLVLSRSWPGWIIWCVLPIIFGLRHPPPIDPDRPLGFSFWSSASLPSRFA
jgi:membrane-associated protease RseP (regulator of RpoE activity)